MIEVCSFLDASTSPIEINQKKQLEKKKPTIDLVHKSVKIGSTLIQKGHHLFSP